MTYIVFSGTLNPTQSPYNVVNYGPLAEFGAPPANFNRFRLLAALLHGTLVVGVSQILRR